MFRCRSFPSRSTLAAGASLEAAAREARYGRSRHALAPGECLLTAHHRAGSGRDAVAAGAARRRPQGSVGDAGCAGRSAPAGICARCSTCAQRDVRAFGARSGIAGGRGSHESRTCASIASICARQVWPLIEKRWPGAATALSRTARHAAEAQELLDASAAPTRSAAAARRRCAVGAAACGRWRRCERINAVRHWLCDAPAARRRRPRGSPKRCARCSTADARSSAGRSRGASMRCAAIAIACFSPPPSRRASVRARARGRRSLRDPISISVPGSEGCVGFRRSAAWTPAGCRRRLQRAPAAAAGRRSKPSATRENAERAAPVPVAGRTAVDARCAAADLRGRCDSIAVGDLWLDARWCVAAGEPGLAFRWDSAAARLSAPCAAPGDADCRAAGDLVT